MAKTTAPHAEAALATPESRRRVTQDIVTNFEHIPVELLAHQMLGVASCTAALALIDRWHPLFVAFLEAERLTGEGAWLSAGNLLLA